jgi:thiol-disulfide isomerase/thioredoxin
VLARWLTPPLALLLAACSATEVPPPSPAEDAASPFLDCAALTAGPTASAAPAASGAGLASGSGSAPGSGSASADPASVAGDRPVDLPDLSLPCFTGDRPVRLTELRGPAVINLWGSWCGPCREELPVMQALADATAGRLRVVGVDTRDTRDSAASFAAARGISFPTLFDPDQKLLLALGRINVPLTVFIAADGKRFVHTGKALDKPTLGGLVRAHTGVAVTG